VLDVVFFFDFGFFSLGFFYFVFCVALGFRADLFVSLIVLSFCGFFIFWKFDCARPVCVLRAIFVFWTLAHVKSITRALLYCSEIGVGFFLFLFDFGAFFWSGFPNPQPHHPPITPRVLTTEATPHTPYGISFAATHRLVIFQLCSSTILRLGLALYLLHHLCHLHSVFCV